NESGDYPQKNHQKKERRKKHTKKGTNNQIRLIYFRTIANRSEHHGRGPRTETKKTRNKKIYNNNNESTLRCEDLRLHALCYYFSKLRIFTQRLSHLLFLVFFPRVHPPTRNQKIDLCSFFPLSSRHPPNITLPRSHALFVYTFLVGALFLLLFFLFRFRLFAPSAHLLRIFPRERLCCLLLSSFFFFSRVKGENVQLRRLMKFEIRRALTRLPVDLRDFISRFVSFCAFFISC
ncbi:transmembrane protein, putative, partial [Bodo saltans]